MSRKVKFLLIAVMALSLLGLFAACGNDDDIDPNEGNGGIDNNASAWLSTEHLVELNIYYHGLKTSIPVDNSDAEQLVALLDAAIAENEDSVAGDNNATASELLAQETCLELVYDQAIQLPFASVAEDISLQRIMYAAIKGETDGLVYGGSYNYNESALAAMPDNGIAAGLQEYIAKKIEKALFSDGNVMIDNMTIPYLDAYSDEFKEPLRSQLIYNALAFYQNCYYKNFAGNTHVATAELNTAVAYAAENAVSSNSHGEDYILHLDNYFDIQVPLSLQVMNEANNADYIVILEVDAVTTLEIIFLADKDGYPLVNALRLTVI